MRFIFLHSSKILLAPSRASKSSTSTVRSLLNLQNTRAARTPPQKNFSLELPQRQKMTIGVPALLERYYPTHKLDGSTDVSKVSDSLYPKFQYTEVEKTEIAHWLEKASTLPGSEEDLVSLNTHLASRTTIIGTKPSIADVAVFSRLEPTVKAWSDEQRTGQKGHHHVVRYIDFVQNAPLFGISIAEKDKVDINPDTVVFVPKPLDPKEEKERKKKEKEAAAAAAVAAAGTGPGAQKTLVTGQTKDTADKSTTEKVKEKITSAKEAVKEAVTGAAAGGAAGAATSKKEKKEKAPKPQKAPAKETPLSPALIDLRVGHILKAVAHPNADSLYVSTIACGDAPGTENTSEYEGQVVRTVCSGLNGLIPLEEMQNRKIVAVCNLKPVTMRGVKSCAMVLAASPRLAEGEVDNHAGPVELVTPPAESKAGDRILFDGWDGEPEGVLNPKKKVWEMCQVGFTTTDDLGVAFEVSKVEQLNGEASSGKPALGRLRVKGGEECTVKSLKDATVR